MSSPPQPQVREGAEPRRERGADSVGEARVADRDWRIWARNLAVAGAAGLFLAFSGAMETGQLPLAIRLLYWMPLMIGGAFVGFAMANLVARIPRAGANPWIFGALLALALSVPVTFVVWGYTNLLFAQDFAPSGLTALFAPVLLISAAMTAIMMLVNRPGRVTHAPPAGAPPANVRFLERLPAKLKGAALYAVSAEDHYLRLHTSKGADLILMRLGDAIGELEGLEGAQTHRSWWVAKDAVESVRRDGDRVTLVLKGGAEAPVSRPNVKALRVAGWF
jgi:DNA-binding LytR/AlgR family response regulator